MKRTTKYFRDWAPPLVALWLGAIAGSCGGNETSSGLDEFGGDPLTLAGLGGNNGAGGLGAGGTLIGGTAAGGALTGGTSAGGMAAGGAATGGISSGGGIATGGTAISSGGANATGGAATGGEACVIPETEARRHPGVYDYVSCYDCHADWIGGWVYSNGMGDAWVEGATVTITNSDDSTVVVPTAEDGFFHLEGTITPTFTPCVSRCSDISCAQNTHTSTDCQTPECHGSTGRLIFLTLSEDAQGTGGTSGATNCTPPASGGPRMHYPEYDGQTCALCHDETYIGGYVYDGLTSDTPVTRATLTLTAEDGNVITAITGPGGMFQIVGNFTAPYTACVGKCPEETICSAPTTHPTTDDCVVCHSESLRIHLP